MDPVGCAMKAVALFPSAGSSGNCADRQDSAVILTASRVRIEATVEEARVLFTQTEVTTPMLQLAASAAGGDIPERGANEGYPQRHLW